MLVQNPQQNPPKTRTRELRLALPKGRMETEVLRLLSDAGVDVRAGSRSYRPTLSLDGWNVKSLKPRNIVGMLGAGARDVGFAGADWVEETGVDLVELLDTKLNPVRLVIAAPPALLEDGSLPNRPIVVASEYVSLAQRWIESTGIDATVLQAFGATEVFPPEDADCIVDNTSTGATLIANGLKIVDDILTSSTRFYANPRALDNPIARERIEQFVLLLESVLNARKRVMVDLNVATDDLERVVAVLPAMREPSISKLNDGEWFAVRAAVVRTELTALIPQLRAKGARDIVTTSPEQIIP